MSFRIGVKTIQVSCWSLFVGKILANFWIWNIISVKGIFIFWIKIAKINLIYPIFCRFELEWRRIQRVGCSLLISTSKALLVSVLALVVFKYKVWGKIEGLLLTHHIEVLLDSVGLKERWRRSVVHFLVRIVLKLLFISHYWRVWWRSLRGAIICWVFIKSACRVLGFSQKVLLFAASYISRLLLGRYLDAIWRVLERFCHKTSWVLALLKPNPCGLVLKIWHILTVLGAITWNLLWIPDDTGSLLSRFELKFGTARIQGHVGRLPLHICRSFFKQCLIWRVWKVWFACVLNFGLIYHSLETLLRSQKFASKLRVEVLLLSRRSPNRLSILLVWVWVRWRTYSRRIHNRKSLGIWRVLIKLIMLLRLLLLLSRINLWHESSRVWVHEVVLLHLETVVGLGFVNCTPSWQNLRLLLGGSCNDACQVCSRGGMTVEHKSVVFWLPLPCLLLMQLHKFVNHCLLVVRLGHLGGIVDRLHICRWQGGSLLFTEFLLLSFSRKVHTHEHKGWSWVDGWIVN